MPQTDRRKAVRQGAFRDVVQAGGATALRPRECSTSIRSGIAPRKSVFEDALKADPQCGIAYWGIALSLLWNPHVPTPAKISPKAPPRSPRARASAPEPSASATISMRSPPCMPTTTRSITARARGLREGDGATGAALSEGRRSADPLRARAQHLGLARRQDLREPAQGRGDPGTDLQTPTAASGRRALSDPPLRHPAIAEKGLDAARRYAKIAPACSARAAHALAHLHARRLLEGIDRIEHRGGARRESRPRTSTTSCTPWTTRSMPICSSARTEGQGLSSTR